MNDDVGRTKKSDRESEWIANVYLHVHCFLECKSYLYQVVSKRLKHKHLGNTWNHKKGLLSLPFTEPKVKLKCSPTDKVYSAASLLPLFAIPVLLLADSSKGRQLLVHLWRRGVGEMFIFTGIPDRAVYLRDIMSQHRGKDINSPLTTERVAKPSIVFPKKLLESNLDTFGKCIFLRFRSPSSYWLKIFYPWLPLVEIPCKREQRWPRL
jgi:hypothetical protein